MRTFIYAIDLLLAAYIWVLLAYMVLYWLIGFGAVDERAHWVAAVQRWLSWLAAPVLRPLRLVVPEIGRVDGSPLLAFVIVMAVRYVIAIYIAPLLPL